MLNAVAYFTKWLYIDIQWVLLKFDFVTHQPWAASVADNKLSSKPQALEDPGSFSSESVLFW